MNTATIVQNIKNLFGKVVESADAKNALVFVEEGVKLSKDLGGNKELDNLVVKAKFLALPLLDPGVIVDLLKNNFKRSFSLEEYDLIRNLKSRMINFTTIDERDELKKNLRRTLEINDEKLTDTKIMSGGNVIRPSVKNWIKDYVSHVGNDPADKVRQVQYLTVSDNIKKLNEQDRGRVKILIEVYEYLKLSSKTPLGHEESYQVEIDGELYHFNEGKLEAYSKDLQNTVNNVLKRIRGVEPKDKLQITSEEREQYKQEKVQKLEGEFGAELEKKAIEEEILGGEDASHLEDRKAELGEMLDRYKEGSLERKVIQDELNNISS